MIGEWADAAACKDLPAATFFDDAFDDGNQRERPVGLAAARKICALCPVREACLEHALAKPEPFGVWGGTTPPERRRLRASRLAS